MPRFGFALRAALIGLRAWFIYNPSKKDFEAHPELCLCTVFGMTPSEFEHVLADASILGGPLTSRNDTLEKLYQLKFLPDGYGAHAGNTGGKKKWIAHEDLVPVWHPMHAIPRTGYHRARTCRSTVFKFFALARSPGVMWRSRACPPSQPPKPTGGHAGEAPLI